MMGWTMKRLLTLGAFVGGMLGLYCAHVAMSRWNDVPEGVWLSRKELLAFCQYCAFGGGAIGFSIACLLILSFVLVKDTR